MSKTYKVGDKIQFVKYAEDLPEGEEAIFNEGDVLIISSVEDKKEGKYIAHKEGDTEVSDTVFSDEIKVAPATKTAAKSAPAEAKKSEEPKTTTKRVKDESEDETVVLKDTKGVKAALKKGNILKTAQNLVAQAEETYFILGGILAHIYYEKSYLKLTDEEQHPIYSGNKGFALYVADELGIEYRKAMYLINIYTHFSNLGVDEKQLATIGWSKAKELVGITTADNMEELIEFAEGHSRNELVDHIKETYVTDGSGTSGGKAKMVTFKFTLFEDKASVLEAALTAAMEAAELDTYDEALDYIVSEWMATHDVGVQNQKEKQTA